MPAVLNLFLVNDYEVVVRGLKTMLSPYADRVRVHEVTAGSLPEEDGDILLVDTFGSHVSSDWVDTLRSCRAKRLVVYTWNVEAALADPAGGAVASGVIGKGLSAEQLVHELERVQAGDDVIVAAAYDCGAGAALGHWPGQQEGLTERESETLSLLVQGLSTSEVAEQVYISVNTVRAHIRGLYRKTGVSTRAQVVLWGIDHGFRPDRERPVTPRLGRSASGAARRADRRLEAPHLGMHADRPGRRSP